MSTSERPSPYDTLQQLLLTRDRIKDQQSDLEEGRQRLESLRTEEAWLCKDLAEFAPVHGSRFILCDGNVDPILLSLWRTDDDPPYVCISKLDYTMDTDLRWTPEATVVPVAEPAPAKPKKTPAIDLAYDTANPSATFAIPGQATYAELPGPVLDDDAPSYILGEAVAVARDSSNAFFEFNRAAFAASAPGDLGDLDESA